ncbi:MAG: thiol reductant ABC exporter subunit CydD [Streptosporangiaceae bacterium]|jgi:ATP-binding cassette subfamily C protein CydD
MRPVDRRLLQQAGAARGYLIFTVVLGLISAILVLSQAGLLARALSGAARGRGLGALSWTLIALLAVVLARAAAAGGGEVAALRAAATVKSQLRRKLTAHALRLGPAWLDRQPVGEIATVATKGLDALDAYFARYLPQLVLACVVPLAVLARILAADWISAVLIAVTLPLIPVFAVLVGLHTRAQTQRQWRLLAALGGHFLDVVEGLPTLKVFGRASTQAAIIGRVTSEHRTATMSTLRVAFLSSLVLELAAALATALVAVEVGLRLLGGHLSYQTALVILLLTPEAYLPLRNVGAQFHASMEGVAAAGRVLDILDVPLPQVPAGAPAGPEPASPPPLSPPGAPACALPARALPARVPPARRPDLRRDLIALTDVTLAYPGRDEQALDRVSLTIRPGERIALTGPSGAGKTTLLALLLRFLDPASGRIEAGGTDLLMIPASWWRRQLAWVPQHPYLFAGTAAQNIALGRPGAGRPAVEQAAAAAGAAGFIEDLPAGYDTPLGERAARLSAGQRQRIALARAFLRDAPLLLLDEPTAHLDPQSAAGIRGAIETLMAGRTVILVTHAAGLVAGADQVLALDRGRLAGAAALGVPS